MIGVVASTPPRERLAWSAVDTLHEADAQTTRRRSVRHCFWCGGRVPESGRGGRPRLYCGQSCRQRAYERRTAMHRGGLPEDSFLLSATELEDLQDRLFQLRCAAEDVVTAAEDGVGGPELRRMAARIVDEAEKLERLR